MDAISIYVNYINKTKTQLEEEMYYIIQQNLELERIIREAREAEKKLKRNKEKIMELAVQYANMKEGM